MDGRTDGGEVSEMEKGCLVMCLTCWSEEGLIKDGTEGTDMGAGEHSGAIDGEDLRFGTWAER